MTMSVEIPTDLQPAIEAAIARGGYANEQELVSDILRAAVPALESTSSCVVTCKRPWRKWSRGRSGTQTSMPCVSSSVTSMTSPVTENNGTCLLVGQGRRERARYRTQYRRTDPESSARPRRHHEDRGKM